MNRISGLPEEAANIWGADIISRHVGAGLEPGPTVSGYPACIFAENSEGVVATCSISQLRGIRYALSISGAVFSPAGLDRSFVTITQKSDGVVLHRDDLTGILDRAD